MKCKDERNRQKGVILMHTKKILSTFFAIFLYHFVVLSASYFLSFINALVTINTTTIAATLFGIQHTVQI